MLYDNYGPDYGVKGIAVTTKPVTQCWRHILQKFPKLTDSC
jgi:hypothetical protein